MPDRRQVLFVTDLAYQARGRRYCDEDIFLTSRLREPSTSPCAIRWMPPR